MGQFRTMEPSYPKENKSNHDANFFYFEFELKKFDNTNEQLNLFVIRDVSKIIKNQQHVCDQMYRDAIEANYSHEQITPLNCILANSDIVLRRVHKMVQELQQHQGDGQTLIRNNETLMLIKMIN